MFTNVKVGDKIIACSIDKTERNKLVTVVSISKNKFVCSDDRTYSKKDGMQVAGWFKKPKWKVEYLTATIR